MSCACGGQGNLPCGCCEGIGARPPQPALRNAPGLPEISYRLGTHGSVLDAMLARLTSHELPDGRRPLQALRTRRSDDASIALLDAWAVVEDVLAFYAERIANEGYLRTALERRSALELGRLLGYRLRPGVSATAYLAYTVDDGATATVPKGSRAMSVPGPGDLPASFETSEDLDADAAWNDMTPRLTRPQKVRSAAELQAIYVNGVTTLLKRGDRLLVEIAGDGQERVVTAVTVDDELQRTLVESEPASRAERAKRRRVRRADGAEETGLGDLLDALRKPASVPPPAAAALVRTPAGVFGVRSGATPQILTALEPALGEHLYEAYGSTSASAVDQPVVSALRPAAPFGANAPLQPPPPPTGIESAGDPSEWDVVGLAAAVKEGDGLTDLPLDAVYDKVAEGDPLVWERDGEPHLARVVAVQTTGIAAYGMSGRVTVVTLDSPWLGKGDDMRTLRATSVYLEPARLVLAEEPFPDDVGGASIELANLIEPPPVGRWLVVSGERTDIPGASGVNGSELVMLAGTSQQADPERPNETPHTVLELATALAYTYKRETVHIRGNVVKSTHGETKTEVLGSGDARVPLQTFPLMSAPLTYLPAANALGAASTLAVRVDGVLWQEADSLFGLGPASRGYTTRTGDDDKTSVVFGTGVYGARVPTGTENVGATYRAGTGRGGNVKAGQISQLLTRPTGVKDVVNPLPGSGGADRESLDSAKRSIPISVEALDRLVGIDDFAAFALARAGIDKAAAAWLTDGRRRFVHLTIAGSDDIPIAPTSDLYLALVEALAACGDPHLEVQVQVRELALIALSAGVHVSPGYEWAEVEPRLRAGLLDAFSFERRDLAEDIVLSRILAGAQAVAGVDYIDVEGLAGIPETVTPGMLRNLASVLKPPPRQRIRVHGARVEFVRRRRSGRTRRVPVVRPAQLALLTAAAPDTLLLREVRP